jgi:hypothetical protein
MKLSDMDRAIKAVQEAQYLRDARNLHPAEGLHIALLIIRKVKEKLHAKRVDQRTRRQD